MPSVRFDDLTPGNEKAFELAGLVDVVSSHHPGQAREALRAVETAVRSGLWAAGYVSYEAASGFDPALSTHPHAHHLPVLWFGLYRNRVAVPAFEPRTLRPAPYHISAWRTEVDKAAHAAAIHEIRTHIEDGETYQVNFTFRLNASFSGEPSELYRDLVLAQRGAWAAYLDTGRHHVLSASPELFFAKSGKRIEVRPMKGTIGRGRWPAEDRRKADQLLASTKDRAENLMIVDLLRNDLGRIAEFGSVRVDELFALERYETVWQLTSRISADMHPGTTLDEMFAALFPSGSVTGAPKARTTEIIADLERTPRGVYCGAVGLLAPGDEAQWAFNVAIRTVTIDVEEGTAEYGVGGGITWDSLSSSEYEEARVKAQLLVDRRPEFSLLETLRWDPDGGFRMLSGHLDRIESSGQYFGFPVLRPRLEAALHEAVAGAREPQRVRIQLSREGTVEVGSVAMPMRFWAMGAAGDDDTIRYAVDHDPVSSQNVFLFHKTTRREVYDQRLKRAPHADDVLLVNERHEITEFTSGNVAVLLDGVWCTPPVDAGLLGGVYRRALVEEGALLERSIHIDDLAFAESVAYFNSVRGWRRADCID